MDAKLGGRRTGRVLWCASVAADWQCPADPVTSIIQVTGVVLPMSLLLAVLCRQPPVSTRDNWDCKQEGQKKSDAEIYIIYIILINDVFNVIIINDIMLNVINIWLYYIYYFIYIK